MKVLHGLPEGTVEIESLHLQKDRKIMMMIQVLGFLIMLLMIGGMTVFRPIQALFDTSQGVGVYIVRFLVLILGYVAYIVLHECTHGAAMRLLGARHVHFGFTGMYAYAGSQEDYFDKTAYFIVALAPLTVWFVTFQILSLWMPPDWFWVVYLLQVGNVSGSMGDIYVVIHFLSLSEDRWILDTGIEMKVYAKKAGNDKETKSA